MTQIYLHQHQDFVSLLNIIEAETGILAGLVEKDYWIMHVLYSLKKQGYQFELKGGTSLSKGFGIIERFSEDIDIHIHPENNLNINPNNRNKQALEDRKEFYNQLTREISVAGITTINRDFAFDSPNLLSGGIRLNYNTVAPSIEGIKEGILLEVGFDSIAPNMPKTISSWAFDKAIAKLGNTIIDNRAIDILCYHPGYTFVEKLQAIATKYRKEQESGERNNNFMRQYYDVTALLNNPLVNSFIGTTEYHAHVIERFPKADLIVPLSQNEAYLINHTQTFADFENRFKQTQGLYYKGQPNFEDVLNVIRNNAMRF